jgi:peptide-methionine (R)-S-oxide reductase
MDPKHFPVEHTDDEWKERLSPAAFAVLRRQGTERAFTSPLNGEKRPGTFLCAGCGEALFATKDKFESGTGWPSFTAPLPGAVGTDTDEAHGMVRTEVHCARCGGHLGHVFEDGPRPTGERFCMNGVALKFRPDSEK